MENRKSLIDLTPDDVETIIRNNYDDIFKYCFWRIREFADAEDAEDLTQETFMKFIEYLPKYQEYGKPKALLYTIARNLCINWRKKSNAIVLTADYDETIANEIIDETEDVLNRLELHNYINKLPAELQEVLFLRYFEGLQVGEIAKILNISRFSVMYRIRTAITNLKTKMGEFNDEG